MKKEKSKNNIEASGSNPPAKYSPAEARATSLFQPPAPAGEGADIKPPEDLPPVCRPWWPIENHEEPTATELVLVANQLRILDGLKGFTEGLTSTSAVIRAREQWVSACQYMDAAKVGIEEHLAFKGVKFPVSFDERLRIGFQTKDTAFAYKLIREFLKVQNLERVNADGTSMTVEEAERLAAKEISEAKEKTHDKHTLAVDRLCFPRFKAAYLKRTKQLAGAQGGLPKKGKIRRPQKRVKTAI